jgi:hypothetical protein
MLTTSDTGGTIRLWISMLRDAHRSVYEPREAKGPILGITVDAHFVARPI